MAYIRKLPSGKWRVEVDKLGIRPPSKTFATKGEATAWGAREEAAILDGARGKFPPRTLTEAIERYIKEVSPGKRGHHHEELRFDALRREFPALCGKVLHAIQTPDIAAWRDARLRGDPAKRRRPVTPGSVQRDINLLRNVFSIARDEWKWCGDPSPFRGLRMPGDNPARSRRVEAKEAYRIARYLGYRSGKEPTTKSQQIAYAFLLGLRTAMRAGEILSLSLKTVDLERRVAVVPHKMQYLTGSMRTIPLTNKGIRLLRPLVGAARDGGLLFTISAKSLDAMFRKCTTNLRIENLHFHDSRAEALTRLAKKYDVMTLARISGHKNISEIFNTYYRESAEDIAKRL